MPYTQSYTVGWQRKLGRDTAFEAALRRQPASSGLGDGQPERDEHHDNGFVNEFRKAQANLQANIAAGRGKTFAYTGAPGT